jgi:hypothetical protein
VNIDVFTLFPEWFAWFASQRHVANVLAGGSRLECVNPREHTPLSGGQVDDTPFGGGAGMVLRVDVLECALRARYGVDPVELRERRRVIALAPGGRVLDESLVEELAGESELTLLCGRYEGFDERIIEHFASDVVSIGRYMRCCASSRGRSGMSARRPRSPSASPSTGTRSIRTTRARPSTAAGACPTCCCPATTRRSSAGVASRAVIEASAYEHPDSSDTRLTHARRMRRGVPRRGFPPAFATIAARAGGPLRRGSSAPGAPFLLYS